MTRRYPPKVEAREKLAERLAFERPWEDKDNYSFDAGRLDERRQNIVAAVENDAEAMRQSWAERSIEHLEKNWEKFEFEKAVYDESVVRAIRAGIKNHPLVRDWIASKRSIGDREDLRAVHRGLETGIRQERKKDTIWILDELADGLKKGHSVKQTRRCMIRKVDRFLEGQETPPEKYGLTPDDLARLAQRIKSIDALYKLRIRYGLRVEQA